MADAKGKAPSRRKPTNPAPTTPDPIEIAMEAEASGDAPEGVAHEVLRKQGTLLSWQIASERAGLAFRATLGLGLLAALLLLGWAAWDASRASGTVVAPFDSAPGLEAQGLTGTVIANEIVGRVAAMQRATGSDRQSRSSSSSADQINVVIPQTGISLGEAQRLLRAWLGHETRISGGLRPDGPNALALTLQVDGVGVSVPAPPDDRLGSTEAWLDAAAQATMRESDPYRYGVWLLQDGRVDEAEGVYITLARTGPDADRAWGWIGLAQVARWRGDIAAGLVAAETALRLNPRLDSAASVVAMLQRSVGHDEQARQGWVRTVASARLGAANTTDRRGRLLLRTAQLAAWDNDWLAVRDGIQGNMRRGRWGQANYSPNTIWLDGLAQARLHEWTSAGVLTDDRDAVATDYSVQAKAEELAAAGRWAELEAVLAQPWSNRTFVIALSKFGELDHLDVVMRRPWQAYVAARLGRIQEAEALIAQAPLDCYFCLRMRGRIAAIAGQTAAADHWFAEAVRQAPSLANADQEWAEVKLARGDRTGALTLAEQAARKAPRWADPLELWGEILLAEGDANRAAAKFAAAANLAPRWGRLHLKWGEALAQLGKADEARAKWRAAATMDLSPADRATLRAHGV